MTRFLTLPNPLLPSLRVLLLCGVTVALLGGCRDYTCADTATCPLGDAGVATATASIGTVSAPTDVPVPLPSTPATSTTTTAEPDVPRPLPTDTSSSPGADPTTSQSPGVNSEPELAGSSEMQTSDNLTSSSDGSDCNECSSGETSCAEGNRRVCELQNGCWTWGASQPCPDGTCASTVDCAECTDVCSLGTEACSDGSLQTCEPGPNGCNVWSAPSLCDSEECADDSSCFVCDDQCQTGEARCTSGQLARCESDSQGCWDWGAPTACNPASCATSSSCAVCNNQCSVGQTSCNGGNLRNCVADAQGCLDWSTATACSTGACSSATQCLVCSNKCSSAGSTSCQGGQLRTCVADANGCLDWGAASTCSTGACSSSSACLVCDNKCTSGSYSCSGSQLNACTADARGCYDYTLQSTCSGNTPVCSANNKRCECQSGAAPTCPNTTTVSQCSSGVWSNSACTGSKPACVDGLGCQACTEHSQCPDSACHLAGAKKGTCFAANTVKTVSSAATLLNAVNATTANGEVVIKMNAGTYTMTSALGPKGETAIIGQSGVIIVDNMPFPGDARAGFLGSGGTTYISKVQLRNTSADHAGIGGSTGTVLWVDDSTISGEYHGVLTNGEIHLRRTAIWGHRGSGAAAYYGGSLFVENSMIGPAAPSYGTEGVGARFGAVLDVRYSTIVGNEYGVGCIVGDSSGRIANSIIASNLNGHSISSDSGDCSQAFTLVTNAVDQTGYGTKIPVYSSTWFVSANNGDLHLSNAGKVAIPTIAVRGSGDPVADFDGNSRPANSGYPGADEP